MNRIAAAGLAVALSLAPGAATAADPVKAPPAKKADDKGKPPATPQRPPVIIAPLSADALAEAVKDEQAACTRRLDACAKLREVAVARNDDVMLQKIDEVEKQAVELCQARVARLGVRGKAARPPEKAPALAPPDAATVAPPAPADPTGGK